MRQAWLLATLVLAWALPVAAQDAPAVDHHQHLFSPAIAEMLTGKPKGLEAGDLLPLLNAAGISKAVVLSAAYMYGSPARSVEDEYAKVRAENDWNGAQAAKHPDRLLAFCSFNPLRPYALDELARCAADPRLRRGIKLHFGNSDVQLDNPGHVDRLAEVFKAANERRMAVVVHLRASVSNRRPYGRAEAQVFLDRLLPLVPDVIVQVAHMAGTGPGYHDPDADGVMSVLADAVQRKETRTRGLWFDVASCADRGIPPRDAALLVRRVRQVGVDRILYGSDAAAPGNLVPREGWAAFRNLPLTDDEFLPIARNVAPYLR